MKKISNETSSLTTSQSIKSNSWGRDGFSKFLDEAMLASDKKRVSPEVQILKRNYEISDENMNRLMTNVAAVANSNMSMEEKKRKLSIYLS